MIPSIRKGQVRPVFLPGDTGNPRTEIGIMFYGPELEAQVQAAMRRKADAMRSENPAISHEEVEAACFDIQMDAAAARVKYVKNGEDANGDPFDLAEGKDAREWASTLPSDYAYQLIAILKHPPASSVKSDKVKVPDQGKESASPPK